MRYLLWGLLITLLLNATLNAQENYYAATLDNFRESAAFKEAIDPENADAERLNAVIFYLTNELRQKRKLPLLTYHPLLEKAATIHSENMKKDEFFDHIHKRSKQFREPADRARFAGIANPYISENIIESFVLAYQAGEAVYPGPTGVFRYKPEGAPIAPHTYLSLGEIMMKDWMNSPHHKANIIDIKAKQLGCGSAFFTKKDFNSMPSVLATQNFQLHESIRVME
jgi:uncharacterized protein YkwD